MLKEDAGWKPGKNNKAMQILAKLAKTVREEGPLDHGVLAVKCGMAPSTLYGYRDVLLELFPDVRFDRGTYLSIQDKPRAGKKGQLPLPSGSREETSETSNDRKMESGAIGGG